MPLLKTLEEPPSHVKFLLATTDPQKLPVTILSRCLQFHLKALDVEQIQQQLAHVLSRSRLTPSRARCICWRAPPTAARCAQPHRSGDCHGAGQRHARQRGANAGTLDDERWR